VTTHRLAYAHRHAGLDHHWYEHEPTHTRRPLVWPGGNPVALWITVPVEFFPLDASLQPVRPLGALDRGYPDFWSYSNRDYGTRLGIYRIMRVLDRFNLRATGIVNAAAATRYPRVIAEIVQRNWEVASGGMDMGRPHHELLSVEDERALVRDTSRILREASDRPLVGWHSPGHSQSSHTLPLLAEAGFQYVMDWVNDDLPYMIKTGGEPLCAMPLTYQWSDRLLLVHHNLTVEDYENQVWRAFRQLQAEAEQRGGGRILSLSVSPWIIGYPHRIAALERILTSILSSGSIWHATGMEIVNVFKSQLSEVAEAR
jgi:peptidoglycan/xylan/chitin deacetylase (PgdA/CDA1 family)